MKTRSIAAASRGFGRLWYERAREIAADSTLCQGTTQLRVQSSTQVLVIHLW